MSILVKLWGAESTPIGNRNWGDSINEELVRLISGRNDIKIVEVSRKMYIPNYVVVGSVLKFVDEQSTIWGSGFLDTKDYFQFGKPKKICAVRGPQTRQHCLNLKTECPEIYGDPVLLFPRYYKPKVKKKYKLGLVPHWKDNNWHPVIKNLFFPADWTVIRYNCSFYEFIDKICECERIASSSLHGLIVSDAYNIPNVRLIFLPQDDFKYLDYYESTNKRWILPINCNEGIDFNKIEESEFQNKIEIDLDKLYNACPFK